MKSNVLKFAALASILPASFAYAGSETDTSVKISGSLDSQYGIVHEKESFRYKLPGDKNSGKLPSHGLVNKTRLKFDWDQVADNGLKYGASIKLRADTFEKAKGRIADKTYGYLEGDFGRIELGSYLGASVAMRQSAASIAKAAGGIDGEAAKWFNRRTIQQQDFNPTDPDDKYIPIEADFVADPSTPVGAAARPDANKITYYTPEYSGLQFGISYTPDIEILGTISSHSQTTKYVEAGEGYSFRNVFEGGFKYTYNIDDIKFTSSLLGQVGKAKQPSPQDNTTGNVHINPLRAWEFGTKAEYSDWAFAASYGDWGKSTTAKERKSGYKYGSKYWTAGVAKQFNDLAASLTYFGSRSAGRVYKGYALDDVKYNKLAMISLGLEYNLAPGIMPYAEINRFKHTAPAAERSNSGHVILMGTKLEF
jgi:hypothetical protein